jgi:NAD(P)-dependent dehydrogenase (short-subunit alcohol dehydrogenase family)
MGADIVVAELNRENAERTASEVRGLGRRSLVVPTDVTSCKDLAAMVEPTRAKFGRIDALVNNAGIYRAAEPLDITVSPRSDYMTGQALSVDSGLVMHG